MKKIDTVYQVGVRSDIQINFVINIMYVHVGTCVQTNLIRSILSR